MEDILNNIYIHAIGEVNEEKTYDRIVSILKYKNIYSRQKMDELGIQYDGANTYGLEIPSGKEFMFYSDDIHYDVISLHDPQHHLINRIIKKNKEFGCFRPTKIALAISRDIPVLPINETKGIDIGEVQVKDLIPVNYIVGIIIPNNEYLSPEVQQQLCEILKQKFESEGFNLPIYDYQGNVIYQPEPKKRL